ncbi:MAG: uroporphyrinogen decarboxylase family protein [bacterium]
MNGNAGRLHGNSPMNHRERFRAVMNYEPFDRVPALYFGTWPETLTRWLSEGLASEGDIPQAVDMDPDWERGMWDGYGIVNIHPISEEEGQLLEETADYAIWRTPLGGVDKHSKHGSSIPQHLEYALKPERADWRRFLAHLNPHDPRRLQAGWQKALERLKARENFRVMLGGSLFGWVRDWMGIEQISMLAFDDPALCEEIVDYLAWFYAEVNRPLLKMADFDLVYIFEDCCFNTGPLISPRTFDRIYKLYYRRLAEFYKGMGVPFVMLDSDGNVEALIGHWLDSGIDILFPIEVGTWRASPVELRRRWGKQLRIMGGVDKLVIPRGERALREHLEPMRATVAEGGFIPLPDHRLPPDVSLDQFRDYIRVFKEVFWPLAPL